MALNYQAAGFGDGLECTDDLGGCISFGHTTDTLDSDFHGQAFTLGFAFQLKAAAGNINTCRWGMANSAGTAKRFYLQVTSSGSFLNVTGILDTDACGFQIVFDQALARDTDPHSVAWAYDASAGWRLVIDGGEFDNGAATCADISEPFAASDTFTIWSSLTFGDDDAFWVGQAYYTNEALSATRMILIQAEGLP